MRSGKKFRFFNYKSKIMGFVVDGTVEVIYFE